MQAYRAARKRHSPFRTGVLLLLGLAVLVSTALPATFEELYAVSVTPDPALTGQQREIDATRRAMARLLVRVTGRREAAAMPGLDELIANADNYRDFYLPLAADEIRIGFRRTPVNEALTRLNQPIWGEERPATLLWVVTEPDAGERPEIGTAPDTGPGGGPLEDRTPSALTDDAEADLEALMETLLDAADERGLPVELPRLDDADQALVRFADVWGGFDGVIERAAERYEFDVILIGRVATLPTGPEIRWVLSQGDAIQEFTSTVPREGIDRLADQLAAEYTSVGPTRQHRVTISEVRSPRDYLPVLDYLQSLSIVDAVEVDSISTTGVLSLRVTARGDEAQLRSVMTLGGVLAAPPRTPTGPAAPFAPPGSTRGLEFLPAWRAGDAAAERP